MATGNNGTVVTASTAASVSASASASAGQYAGKVTKWPESVPSSENECFFSVSCGTSWIRWALHSPLKNKGKPLLYWRTPILENNFDDKPLVKCLLDYLPQRDKNRMSASTVAPVDYIFGEGCEFTVESAITESKKRDNPKVDFYLVSSNSTQITRLTKMISCIPSNVYLMKETDFFTKEQGLYDGLEIDRVAALLGAKNHSGFPALVFNGGTTLTYTAADSNGNIMGGGMSPGLSLKLQSMFKGTSALPEISVDRFVKRVKEVEKSSTRPLPTFGRNTEDEMIATILSEIAFQTRHIVKQWLDKVGSSSTSTTSSSTSSTSASSSTSSENSDRVVQVTGGTADILYILFGKKCGNLVETMDHEANDEIKVVKLQNLVHWGVAEVVYCNFEKVKQEQKEKESIAKAEKAKQEQKEKESIAKAEKAKQQQKEKESIAQAEKVKQQKEKESSAKKSKSPFKRSPNKPSPMEPKKKRAKETTIIKPKDYIGRDLAKYFEKDVFFGKVDKYRNDEDDGDLWHVTYSDGDEEELDKGELEAAMKLFEALAKSEAKKLTT